MQTIVRKDTNVSLYYLEDGKTVGTIDKIEKNKAVVNYGLFTTSVNVNRLEYVSK